MRFAFYRQQKHITAHLDRFAFSSDGEIFLYSYTTSKELLDQMRSFLSSNVSLFSHPGRSLHESFSCMLDKLNAGLKLPDFRLHLTGQQHFLIYVHRGNEIHFSVMGTIYASYLSYGKIVGLSEGMCTGGYEFGYISSGEVNEHAIFFVSHRQLQGRLIEADLVAISESQDEDILYQNIEYIWNEHTLGEGALGAFLLDPQNIHDTHTQENSMYENFSKSLTTSLRVIFDKMIGYLKKYPYFMFDRKRKVIFFLFGVVLSCVLLFVVLSSLIRVVTTSVTQDDATRQLLDIRNHLEEATRYSIDREVFTQHIKKAEEGLASLESSQFFLQDRIKLTQDIDILKKQVNGVISISPSADSQWYTLPASKDNIIGVYEMGQKFVIVTNTSIIDGINGEQKPVTSIPLPPGEEAIDATKSDDGSLYILLKSLRVARYTKGEIKTVSIVSVAGSTPPLWEKAKKIKSFIGNIYLLSEDGANIYRYRPVVSSFSSRSDSLLSNVVSPYMVQDFSLDGSIYLLRSNASIEKITTGANMNRKTLLYKNLPANTLPIQVDQHNSRLILSQNSKYIFIISNGDVMVFRPNTLTSSSQSELGYLGTIDISDEDIVDLSPTSDSVFMILTKKKFYRLEFQLTDDKILPR
ncbi:MAG: hypothetical protein U0518_04370 [Candidatus Gracilibacteria bacterium]